MKIVFTAKGTEWNSQIDPRFGRTDYLVSYDETKDELICVDNRDISLVGHGAGTKTSQTLLNMNPDILITGNGPGGNAARALAQTTVKTFIGASGMTVKEAYELYKLGQLQSF